MEDRTSDAALGRGAAQIRLCDGGEGCASIGATGGEASQDKYRLTMLSFERYVRPGEQAATCDGGKTQTGIYGGGMDQRRELGGLAMHRLSQVYHRCPAFDAATTLPRLRPVARLTKRFTSGSTAPTVALDVRVPNWNRIVSPPRTTSPAHAVTDIDAFRRIPPLYIMQQAEADQRVVAAQAHMLPSIRENCVARFVAFSKTCWLEVVYRQLNTTGFATHMYQEDNRWIRKLTRARMRHVYRGNQTCQRPGMVLSRARPRLHTTAPGWAAGGLPG